jgi:cystathionine gamma-synthase
MKPETKAIHAGYQIDPSTGALTAPIHLSSTYERDADGEFSRGYIYTRSDNPNRNELEQRLTALEGGHDGLVFASGSAAMMSLVQALKTGDHVIVSEDIYFGVQVIFREIMRPWGLESNFVDMSKLDAVKNAVRENTKMLIIETPSNPQIKITDIAAIAAIAHENGASLVCDNTIPTPIFQRPLELGADFVVHSTTKYMGGHSDVLGGAVIAKEDSDFFAHLRRIQKIGGAVPSPFDCYMLLRGVATLPYRMRAINENAQMVALYLEQHPQIEQVLHPALESHPQHELVKKQMTGTGGLFSILVKGGQAEAMAVTAKLALIKRATSFGGVHTTIEHRASIEENTTTPQNLLRLSIGLEHPDDIIADFEQALS